MKHRRGPFTFLVPLSFKFLANCIHAFQELIVAFTTRVAACVVANVVDVAARCHVVVARVDHEPRNAAAVECGCVGGVDDGGTEAAFGDVAGFGEGNF